MSNKRILSGMQPTAHLHLGNYLGALRNWVDLQKDYECLFCVVDLHAITMPYDRDALTHSTREIAAAYIAAGVDVDNCTLFVQSAVPEHSQLMWLLATMAQFGKLSRMTQFKDKAGKNSEKAGLGLFAYPVLMAADILIYKATHVPVGEDQKQHLELARDLAATFNTRYGVDFFPQPEPQILGEAKRIMSLRDGTQKMSKSAESDNSRINLTDDADTIAAKIRKAKTDPEPLPDNLEDLKARPEADNLVTIYAALSGETREKVIARFGGQQFSAFKPALADVAVAHLSPITTRLSQLLAEPDEIDRLLIKGADKARSIAAPVLQETMDIMGFWRG
ncbi:MAG: tryptophan--tRNA ligase [Alphaproteobacteria bacterium]|nr:tryptophan--tRNA ligase [Alphaproteobacteria bacterium]MBU0860007.1 tryptophan--tRNA ligase [Alphaproteobacteria bacterium]